MIERPGYYFCLGLSLIWINHTLQILTAHAVESRSAEELKNVTTNSGTTVQVQGYLSELKIDRTENPLHFWERQKCIYPDLNKPALGFLFTPQYSKTVEKDFYKTKEVFSKKRSRLSLSIVKQIVFLEKKQ